MRRKPQSIPIPAAPTISAILIDGANVIASGPTRARERLDLALCWLKAWQPTLPIEIFLDHSTLLRCRAEVQAELQTCQTATAEKPLVVLCHAGLAADIPLLHRAAEVGGLILSNDRFFDHTALRANAMTLQFTLDRLDFIPAQEVTWFRSKGMSLRIPIANLLVRRLVKPAD
ncbi:MAG: hypothetical protein WCR59_00110 [Planctomycetota bacterium]|jgi:hypothetical protein